MSEGKEKDLQWTVEFLGYYSAMDLLMKSMVEFLEGELKRRGIFGEEERLERPSGSDMIDALLGSGRDDLRVVVHLLGYYYSINFLMRSMVGVLRKGLEERGLIEEEGTEPSAPSGLPEEGKAKPSAFSVLSEEELKKIEENLRRTGR